MWGKYFLSIVLCCFSIVIFAQDQKELEVLHQDIISECPMATSFMTFLFQLDKIAAEGYFKKNTENLPIWCANCKQSILSLGEFSACLMLQSCKASYDAFLKLLASIDTKETEMVDFVIEHIKNIQYPCTNCKNTSWERITKKKTPK